MSRVVRVRFERGVLKPLEPLDLREYEERLAVLIPVGEERGESSVDTEGCWVEPPGRR